MAYRDAQDVERRTLALLAGFGGRLRPDEVEEMESLIVAGEPGVALENMCVQLYEHDAPVDPSEVAAIAEVGDLMRIDPFYWRPLASPPAST
jgi:hypothetical protein